MTTYAHLRYYFAEFLEWAIFSDVEKIKTRLTFSILFPENLAIYEIIWKNIV